MRTPASYPAFCHSTSLATAAKWCTLVLTILVTSLGAMAIADEPIETAETPVEDAFEKAMETQPVVEAPISQPVPELPPFPAPPEGAQRLSKKGRAWMDKEKHHVIVDGRISLRRGLLEMFACPPNTKEHESIVAVDSEAFVLHAGLLAVGAEPGTPVQFVPEYQAPTGTQIDIDVLWTDKDGKQHEVKAQEWIRDARTNKPMDLPWVFAGSGFWRDEQTGNSGYLAEAGDLVCVANFSTAMLDVPAELTNDNSGLLFEAFTERIPPLGWPVRLVLKPVLDEQQKQSAAESPAGEPASDGGDAQNAP